MCMRTENLVPNDFAELLGLNQYLTPAATLAKVDLVDSKKATETVLISLKSATVSTFLSKHVGPYSSWH